METLEALLTRRSIRHYTSAPVSEDLVKTLLKAAMFAPSASNGQPWHFVVIRYHALLDAIPKFHPNWPFWCAGRSILPSLRIGWWIVLLPLRTCFWQLTPVGWARSGWGLLLARNACRGCAP